MEFDRVPPIAKYLSAIFLIGYLGKNLAWYFLPIFFENHIESVFLVGVLTSLPAAIPIILDIPVGNLVQRAGEKITIFVGLILSVIPGLFYFTAVPLLLVGGKIFEGLMKTFIWNGGWSLSMESSDEESESESLSVFLLGVNLAAVAGPMLGGYLIASNGFNLAFALWVFSAWTAAMVFYLYIGLEGKRGFFDSLEELFHRGTYLDDYHHLKQNWESIRFPMLLIGLYSILFSFFWLAVPLLLDRVGAGFETMGLIFGVAAMPKLFQYFWGDLADKYGKLKVSAILGALLTPVLVAMGVFSNIYLLGGIFLLARLFATGFSPALHAFFDSRVPDELEGELTGFLEFAKHTGQSLGPLMAGAVSSVWSVSHSFYFAAVVSFLLFGLCFWGSTRP